MYNKTIYVKPPLNSKRNNCLFYRRSYEIALLKILQIKNITATYDGICFKNSRIIKESVQAYPDKIRIFELESQLQFKNKLIKHYSGNNQYLMIHHPWLNYYHWLTEAIPRIWLVKDILNQVTLLLPDYYKNIKFVQESLKPFKHKKIEYIPNGYNIRIDNAIIPQIKPFCSSYDPDVVNEIRSFYIEYAKKSKTKTPALNNRIYIMRGNNMRRIILNEEDLMRIFEKYDFSSVRAESFSFLEQVLFSENAECLISNGSGLTNMHFMKEGSTVLELQKKITNINDFHDKVLWHLASALNLNYYYFICEPENKHHDMYTANLKIDLKKFEDRIIKMLNHKK